MLDQPAADQRRDGRGDRSGGGPGADGLAARLAFIDPIEQSKAVRQQQACPDPLKGAAGKQRLERAAYGTDERADAK